MPTGYCDAYRFYAGTRDRRAESYSFAPSSYIGPNFSKPLKIDTMRASASTSVCLSVFFPFSLLQQYTWAFVGISSNVVTQRLQRLPVMRPSPAIAVTKDADEISPSQGNPLAIQPDKNKKVAVLICPAQFCVPIDYETLIMDIKELGASTDSSINIGSCRVAPLPRTEWIKVARNLPTRSFVESTLPVYETLDWYFDAMEDALSEIYAEEGEDVNICIIGHSIGGWVARAYLGGLSL